jgi:hypothetical protein
MTRALRATATLAATLFFLEGECALAQAPAEPLAPSAQSAPGSLSLEEKTTDAAASRKHEAGGGLSFYSGVAGVSWPAR